MKNIISIAIFLTFFAGFLFISSCKKDLTELNVNPNEPISTDLNYLFRYAQKEGISSYNSNVNLEQWSLMNWMMYMASRGGVEAGREYIVPTGKDAFWTEQYATALVNTHQILLLTKDSSELSNMYAAATIWKIFLFHRITDLWGDIPYSDALKAATELNYAPRYDKQQEVYYSMLDGLKNAESTLSPDKMFFNPSADIIGKGNIDFWKRFANSLRLRLATRIKNRNFARYQQEMNDLSTRILITSNVESILFPYNSERKHPVFEAYFTQQAIVQNNPSKFFVDMLVNSNDPRVKVFLEKSPMSILPWIPPYKGVPNLVLTSDPIWSQYNSDGNWGDISRIGQWFLRNQTPGIIISYAEVCFLKAEAALEGAWTGSAQSFFEDGIRANMLFYEQFGDTAQHISDAQILAYQQSLPSLSLEQIITQKWISFAFSNGYESYAEYRRTGFPVLKKMDNSNIDYAIFPKRITYPNFESTLNRSNYLEAVANQGQDNEFTKLWWMN